MESWLASEADPGMGQSQQHIQAAPQAAKHSGLRLICPLTELSRQHWRGPRKDLAPFSHTEKGGHHLAWPTAPQPLGGLPR